MPLTVADLLDPLTVGSDIFYFLFIQDLGDGASLDHGMRATSHKVRVSAIIAQLGSRAAPSVTIRIAQPSFHVARPGTRAKWRGAKPPLRAKHVVHPDRAAGRGPETRFGPLQSCHWLQVVGL